MEAPDNSDAMPRGAASRERLVEAAVELVVQHHESRDGLRGGFGYVIGNMTRPVSAPPGETHLPRD